VAILVSITTVVDNQPSSQPTLLSMSHSTEYSRPHSTSVSSATSSASSLSVVYSALSSGGGGFSGFEFDSVCDQPVSGLFHIKLSGYDEKCSYFSADGSVSQLDMSFEVFALELIDIDVDVTGQHFQVVVFGPGESEGLRFGDVNTIGNNGE
jgi:hypothetical protein